MISTITPSTMTTITAVESAAVLMIITVTLIAILITREVVRFANSSRLQDGVRFSSVGSLPLLMVFAISVLIKILGH